jgi:ribosomal protein S18 acetylase RimI-like enzyme
MTLSASGGAQADVSCRIAWADDADAIAAVQVRAWRASYDGLLPAELLESLDRDALAAGWRTSLVQPAEARQRVLVALERNTVTGFALTSPAVDPDADPSAEGEVADVTVDPERRGRGHASRLMQACVDTLVADGFTTAVIWVNVGDDDLRGFLVEAGWAPDGAHRELDLRGDGEVTVKQIRLHTAVA